MKFHLWSTEFTSPAFRTVYEVTTTLRDRLFTAFTKNGVFPLIFGQTFQRTQNLETIYLSVLSETDFQRLFDYGYIRQGALTLANEHQQESPQSEFIAYFVLTLMDFHIPREQDFQCWERGDLPYETMIQQGETIDVVHLYLVQRHREPESFIYRIQENELVLTDFVVRETRFNLHLWGE